MSDSINKSQILAMSQSGDRQYGCCRVSPVGSIGNEHRKGHTLLYSEPEPTHPQWYHPVTIMHHVLGPVGVICQVLLCSPPLTSLVRVCLHPGIHSCFPLPLCPFIPNHTADCSTAQACRSVPIRSSSRTASQGCQNRCVQE
jgi:hypothetical protein